MVGGVNRARRINVLSIKLLLVLALAVIPLPPAVFALPLISPLAVVAVMVFWMIVPGWGPWVYVGVCGDLVQWHLWLLWRKGFVWPMMSPSLANQNSAAAWLSTVGIAGVIRSWYATDTVGALRH